MTVAELIEALSILPADAPANIVLQPNYPLAAQILDVAWSQGEAYVLAASADRHIDGSVYEGVLA